MKINKVLGLSVIIVTIFIFGCEKEKEEVSEPLVFEKLIIDKDSIMGGEDAEVSAIASGDGIVYSWSVSAGSIVGSGNTVSYVAPPCVMGINSITCTVKDRAKNSLTKSVNIYVY